MKKVRSEVTSAVHSLPWLIARDEGLFGDAGLEVEFIHAPQRGRWRARRDGGPSTIGGSDLVSDPRVVDSVGVHLLFEEGACELYRACEWGQVRRAQDSVRGGQIVGKRPTITTHAILVQPGSSIECPQQLAGQPIGVNFHAGSHYVTLLLLEGFLGRDEIRVVHGGRPLERFEAFFRGELAAVTLMEPWISLAEKRGCKNLGEACYVGSDIASADIDRDTYAALQRAVTIAARRFNADKRRYLHYLIDEIPADLGPLAPEDFHLPRLRCTDPAPYSEAEFRKSFEWMRSWDLIDAETTYLDLVQNRISLAGPA